MSQKIKKDWFILCTKARQELKVLAYLSQLEIETCSSTKTIEKHWSDQKKVKTCLLPPMVLDRLSKNELNKFFDVPVAKRYMFVWI